MIDAAKGQTIAVLGAGSWGLAVARHLNVLGHEVRLWEFDSAAAARLAEARTLPDKLPGIILAASVEVTDDIARAASAADCVAFVTPSTAIRTTAEKVREFLHSQVTLVVLTKGIEVDTGLRMTEIVASTSGSKRVVALVGPSHAEEVARGVPTALVAASPDSEAARQVQATFSSDTLRVYTSDDVIGVELAAALKNIIAIAAGIVDGLGYESADNLKGALITRGLAEITRLGVKMGAEPETFAGLSGVGDLITTCLSRHSRNRHVGEQVGRGRALSGVLSGMSMVAEGVTTTQAAVRLANVHDVDMPITCAVADVLFAGKPAATALAELMARPAQPEIRR
ncbi:MAG: NAD(P)H-dependent glycerol-3-phosphate dehydrogenase [Candidatus Zixiibacteriota bacterium]